MITWNVENRVLFFHVVPILLQRFSSDVPGLLAHYGKRLLSSTLLTDLCLILPSVQTLSRQVIPSLGPSRTLFVTSPLEWRSSVTNRAELGPKPFAPVVLKPWNVAGGNAVNQMVITWKNNTLFPTFLANVYKLRGVRIKNNWGGKKEVLLGMTVFFPSFYIIWVCTVVGCLYSTNIKCAQSLELKTYPTKWKGMGSYVAWKWSFEA